MHYYNKYIVKYYNSTNTYLDAHRQKTENFVKILQKVLFSRRTAKTRSDTLAPLGLV